MRKTIFSLLAATLCLIITSCSNPVSKMQSLAEDIDNNGNEWTDADKWESVIEDVMIAACEFMESDFTEEELLDFAEALTDLAKAVNDIDDRKAKKAMQKGGKAVSKNKELDKRMKKAMKKADKHGKDLDLDEDELLEAFSGLFSL